MLVKRELQSRYAGSTLGVVWNIIHPLVMILIYVTIFSQIMGARISPDGNQFTYAVHLCSGIVPWFLFQEIISRSSTVLVENSNMLKKMALPEEVLFISIFITSLLVNGIGLMALAAILWVMGAPIGPHFLFAFLVMIALAVLATGLGMILSVLTLLIRDVGQLVQIFLQLTFWSLPIVYVPSILPETVQELTTFNPLKGFFALTQWLFGSPDSGFSADSYYQIVLLPFAAILMGIAFLKARKSEILDAL